MVDFNRVFSGYKELYIRCDNHYLRCGNTDETINCVISNVNLLYKLGYYHQLFHAY